MSRVYTNDEFEEAILANNPGCIYTLKQLGDMNKREVAPIVEESSESDFYEELKVDAMFERLNPRPLVPGELRKPKPLCYDLEIGQLIAETREIQRSRGMTNTVLSGGIRAPYSMAKEHSDTELPEVESQYSSSTVVSNSDSNSERLSWCPRPKTRPQGSLDMSFPEGGSVSQTPSVVVDSAKDDDLESIVESLPSSDNTLHYEADASSSDGNDSVKLNDQTFVISSEPSAVLRDLDASFTDELTANLADLSFVTPSECSAALSLSDDDDAPSEAPDDVSGAFPNWVYEMLQFVPKDMAGYKDVIKENMRLDVLVMGRWRHVVVTEIHNPHKFFFLAEADEDQMEEVYRDMRTFYRRHSNDYLTPRPHELKLNLLVAALHGDNCWRRGKVVSETFPMNGKTMCQVQYVDYASVDEVAVDNIRFLHKRFLEAPLFCHRGSLSGVLPIVTDKWSPRAKKCFLGYVQGRIMMATCNKFLMVDRSWHMEIVDCSKEPKLSINMALIKEDFTVEFMGPDLTEYIDYYLEHRPM